MHLGYLIKPYQVKESFVSEFFFVVVVDGGGVVTFYELDF